MPRSGRIVIPNVAHHVTHKGINGKNIFLHDSDREIYLDILRERCEIYGLSILGYCLMTNHVHFVCVPDYAFSLMKVIGGSHRQYARLFNLKYGRKSSLWQDRFFSCALGEGHFLQALIYVDHNPVRAGIVSCPEDYRWSSAASHIGRKDAAGLLDLVKWEKIAESCGWEELIGIAQPLAILEEIRRHTKAGKPLGLGKDL